AVHRRPRGEPAPAERGAAELRGRAHGPGGAGNASRGGRRRRCRDPGWRAALPVRGGPAPDGADARPGAGGVRAGRGRVARRRVDSVAAMPVESRFERARVSYPPRFAEEFADAIRRGLDCGELCRGLAPTIAGLLADPRATGRGRLVLAGSGDSLFAATAALPALRRWSGRPAQVLTSLDLARYEAPLLSPDDVVVGVSNSGNSSRTREGMSLARQR